MLLVLSMVLGMAIPVYAAETVASGTCGENVTWTLDEEETLTISGSGAMENYSSWDAPTPWDDYADQIKVAVVANGVTSIGSYAFCDCASLVSITIPEGVTSIGNYAFHDCSSLTDEQKAMVKEFSSDMIGAVISADANKVGTFKSNGGFSGGYPSVSFEGAFSINYYLTPKQAVEGDITLYCWDLNTYNSVDTLTEENATTKVTMVPATNPAQYFANYAGIAAKQIDETVFVAGVYTSGGVRYSSPVISYSLGAYCADQIANGTVTMQEFAKATAVYGNYAKAYFASLNS